MHIRNEHERSWPVAPEAVGRLVDSLASPDDKLWPSQRWPPMLLDSGLAVGSRGGHGPVRYRVVAYQPGTEAVFAFDPDQGLLRGVQGTHCFQVVSQGDVTTLRHVIDMDAGWAAALRWALLVRPMHDALLEDALDRAEAALTGSVAQPAVWPWRVQYLRRLARRRRVEPIRPTE
jgi:hypothetical protein